MNLLSDLTFVYRETAFLFPNKSFVTTLKRIATVFYCLPNLHAVAQWLKPVGNPLFAKELAQIGDLREFIFRPYVNIKWSMVGRLQAMANHYWLVKNHTPQLNIDNSESVHLFEFNLNDQQIKITLDKPIWMRREGEVALSLFLSADRVYSLMFLLAGDANNLQLVIGNLQGNGVENTEAEQVFTKHFHGLDPRNFLMHILKLLAEHLGCKEINAVSDSAHRSNLWYSRAANKSKNNSVWLACNGKENAEGFFVISPYVLMHAEDDIPAENRAIYRQRYSFLDKLKAQLKDAFIKH